MATIATFGSVGRVHIDNSNPFSDSFVLNKALQLPESPLMHPFVVTCASPDVAQIFHHNSASYRSTINDSLTYVMILPRHELSPPARQSFELSLAGSCAFGLDFTDQPISISAELLELLAEELAVTADGKLVYSDINAQNSVRTRALSIDVFRECKKEKASPSFVHSQQALIGLSPIEVLQIASGNFEWHLDTTFDSSDAQNIVLERSRAREVISYRTSAYDWLGFTFLDHSTGLLDASDGKLCLQSKRTQSLVDKRLQFDIVFDALLPSLINAQLQSFGVDFESADYLWSGFDFDFSCCSGSHKPNIKELIFKLNGGTMQFVPRLNSWAFLLNVS